MIFSAINLISNSCKIYNSDPILTSFITDVRKSIINLVSNFQFYKIDYVSNFY